MLTSNSRKNYLKIIFLICSAAFFITGCPESPSTAPPAGENEDGTSEEQPAMSIDTENIVILTNSTVPVTATITPAASTSQDTSWSTDNDSVTLIPQSGTGNCSIQAGQDEGSATITVVSTAHPSLSKTIDITVVKSFSLDDSGVTGQVTDPNDTSIYWVTELTDGTPYQITLSSIDADVMFGDSEVVIGTATSTAADISALSTDGYSKSDPPLVFQGFTTNTGTSASIIFIAEDTPALFLVEDGTEDNSLGDLTYDIAIAEYSGNKQIIETIHCAGSPGGTRVDTYFYVYNFDEELICGAFDNSIDDGYSKVYLPDGFLPSTCFFRVAAQANNEDGMPTITDPTVFGSTGDFAMYIDLSAAAAETGYSGAGIVPASMDSYELENEHNYLFDSNFSNYVQVIDETPVQRILSPPADISITDGFGWDEDWFRRGSAEP